MYNTYSPLYIMKKTCKKWCFLHVIMQKHRRKSVKYNIFLIIVYSVT